MNRVALGGEGATRGADTGGVEHTAALVVCVLMRGFWVLL